MFAWLMAMSLGSVKAQDVKVEFFTPSIVHVVKDEPTKTLVITAKPENVSVTHTGIETPHSDQRSENTWNSSELTVKLAPETQTLTFLTNKGKVLLKEKSISMVRKNENEFEVDGNLSIGEFVELAGLDEDTFDAESETAGGWVVEKLGHFPTAGEVLETEGMQITVLSMDGLRVEKLLVKIPEKE